ncbi:MAG: T9SS type A sorting domain-containing protein [Sphingobacteriales bacterium]|nr:T9SS type A sorting domain-containing protein [Sphingobacteriales bacterium]
MRSENELSVAHLASGIYFVQAHTKSGKVFTKKFVKR